MVRLLLTVLVFSVGGCSNAASEHYKQDQYGQSLVIDSLIVEENARFSQEASSSEETPEDCQDFILTESQVRIFFKTARVASLRDYSHELMPSKCSASGTLKTEDGQSGFWVIDRARRGLIYFQDGPSYYFYCNDCVDPVFYEACDVECIHSDS